MRTSVTHPLRIDTVTVAATGGQIGMTLCPGRRDRLSREGPWDRDLDRDLAVISCWRPSLVVTLMEAWEFDLLGVPLFAAAVALRPFAWRHLPIPDAGIPGPNFEHAWKTAGAEARGALKQAGRVLIHCRAGLGRTGMIAARLMVELGAGADDAIAAVRLARPGTIETRAQEDHVRRCGE